MGVRFLWSVLAMQGRYHIVFSRTAIARTDKHFAWLAALLLAAALFALPIRAVGQWSLLKSFQQQVTAIYFQDQQGNPTTGFVGLANATVWRTTDNGKTWNQMSTPTPANLSAITQFAFRDSVGWCSVKSQFNTSGQIWKTTDDGQTWTSVFSNGIFVSISYCAASNVLVASSWGALTNAYTSTDLGTTWTSFAPTGQNGSVFSGANGFVGDISAPTALYTTDGGMTWNPSSLGMTETWSPYAIPGTKIFLAAAEKSGEFYISFDGGANWSDRYNYGSSAYITGCIMGTLPCLFVQTENNGFFCSVDTGNSWIDICGPENQRDTRFYSVGTQIFGGDENGGLWYMPNGLLAATIPIALDKDSLHFSGLRCLTQKNFFRVTTTASCSSTGTLISAQFLSGDTAFSLQPFRIPYTLSGNDTFTVLYTPTGATVDSGKLELKFDLGIRTVDTVISLYGTSTDPATFTIDSQMFLRTSYACEQADTAVVLKNLSCDTLHVTGLSFTDSLDFQASSDSLPMTVSPGEFDTIRFLAHAPASGVFHSLLRLNLINGSSTPASDSVPIELTAQTSAHATVDGLDVVVLDPCEAIDTAVFVYASDCDSITLLQASFSDTSVFQIVPMTLPATVSAAGVARMAVHIAPGAQGMDSAQFHVQYRTGTQIIDTTLMLQLRILYGIPNRIDLPGAGFDMGNVNEPCATATKQLTISNMLCKDVTIERIGWKNPTSEIFFDSIPVPIALPSDTGVCLLPMHFTPNAPGPDSNVLDIEFELGDITTDTSITVFGNGLATHHDTTITKSLAFDTIPICKTTSANGIIINLSCDTVEANSATLFSGSDFAVDSPKFPVTIPPDDTLRVKFALTPKQTGTRGDNAFIAIYDPADNSNDVQGITLSGYVASDSHSCSLSTANITMPGIVPCSEADSFFVITNTGNCDDVLLREAQLKGASGVTLTLPASLPIDLPPDSSIRIGFQIAPGSDTLQAASSLTLTGTFIDTTVSFLYSALAGGNTLAASSPDSLFTTRPCVPISKTFWIANTGCAIDTVDTVSLSVPTGGTQFTLDSIPKSARTLSPGDTLFYTVTFDPTLSGTGSTELSIISNGAGYIQKVGLTGNINGTVPSARVALETSDFAAQCSGAAGDTTAISAILLDGVGDTSDLETVTFTITNNPDLLMLTKIVPARGWSIIDSSGNPNGLLTLKLRNESGGAVAVNTAIATCYFAIFVTDSVGCDLRMSGLQFNDSDAEYEHCTLASVEEPGTVRFTETDTCGTPYLRGLLEGQIALKIISVQPNPVSLLSGVAHFDLTLQCTSAEPVTISVIDMLGREVWQTVAACLSGLQTLSLDVPAIAEGPCVVQVVSGIARDIRNVIFLGTE